MELRTIAAAACLLVFSGCKASGDPPPDAGVRSDAGLASPCSLPGSWVHDGTGTRLVPGGTGQPDLTWLTLPVGFCAHHFANVGNARQLRFAPGGELFVASPTAQTTSNGGNGRGAVVVVPDDDQDGLGDGVLTFKDQLPQTQGLLFAHSSFYYQDGTRILREPYALGQRKTAASGEVVIDITAQSAYKSTIHWPKTLDISDSGHIYVGNGGDQGEVCEQPMPFHGGILEIDGSPNGKQIALGFRNPIDVECHRDGHDHCFVNELALDYSATEGGREKLVPIHEGDNWGFPCCATWDQPYQSVTVPCPGDPGHQCSPDCTMVVPDTNSFIIGNTPFGLAFEDNLFPAPWDHRVFVVLHGDAGSWSGARLVAITLDPATGLPLPSSTVGGGQNSGAMVDFATGWDKSGRAHGRPSDVEFSPDGRLFIANDQDGEIFWIAPITGP